jgi:hypothetical protein
MFLGSGEKGIERNDNFLPDFIIFNVTTQIHTL